MKLFQLFKRDIILTLLIVLLLGSFAHFFIFRFFIHRSTDGILYEYKTYIENYVTKNDTLVASSLSVLQPPRVEERLIDNAAQYPQMFKDTLLYSESTGEFLPYRQLYFTVSYKNYSHLVNINQPTVETDDLFYAIISSLVILLLLFVLFSYIIGNYVQTKLWSPFYKLVTVLQNYDLQKTEKLMLEDSGIIEFDELNHVVNKMVAKIHSDFINLKTFTEDVSHEMQTPLSIIKSKLDLLIQSDIINEENINNIQAMSNAVSRLSKFNRSLLLIAKINNNQFIDTELIDYDVLIRNYLDDLSELIAAKNINVIYNCKNVFLYNMNKTLSEIVVSNLLSNAIRYNVINGKLEIILTEDELTIINSSDLIDDSEDLFNRFKKGKLNGANGMGLNIVKSVCDTNKLNISYNYNNNLFTININKTSNG